MFALSVFAQHRVGGRVFDQYFRWGQAGYTNLGAVGLRLGVVNFARKLQLVSALRASNLMAAFYPGGGAEAEAFLCPDRVADRRGERDVFEGRSSQPGHYVGA